MKKNIVFLSLLFFGATFSHAETTGQSGGAYQYYLKALLLESQGNFSAAHEEIEKALSVAPQSAYLYRTAAELSLRLGQVAKAADEIERAVRQIGNQSTGITRI